MQITSNSTETMLGPGKLFTGAAYIDQVVGEHVTDGEYGASGDR